MMKSNSTECSFIHTTFACFVDKVLKPQLHDKLLNVIPRTPPPSFSFLVSTLIPSALPLPCIVFVTYLRIFLYNIQRRVYHNLHLHIWYIPSISYRHVRGQRTVSIQIDLGRTLLQKPLFVWSEAYLKFF